MSYQPINLGTPNNNDGDSLFIGGQKINANFADLYTNLAGASSNALKINIPNAASAPGAVLGWNAVSQTFVPGSSNSLRSAGSISTNSLFVTNSAGASGNSDGDLTGDVNALISRLDGSNMFFLRSRGNTSVGTVRGSLEINLGNQNVTSLSVYTTGTIIRGLNGLTVYKALAEDNATFTKLLDYTTSNTGVTLYQTPSLDIASLSSGVRTGNDSSNALAHTGYVQVNLQKYAPSSVAIVGRRGIISTNANQNLTGDSYFNIDGIYHPKHMEGLIYNYNTISNKITLVTGAAAHWSYSTSGVAGLLPTSAIAIVASYNPIIRTFISGWVPQYKTDGSTPAIIDGSISPNTWYYLYYLGCLVYTSSYGVGVGNEFWPGSSNVVISSNRDIASVDAQLAAAGFGGVWQTVRRIGPVKSNNTGTGIVPFNVKRIDHGAFEYYWGLQPNASGAALGADTSYTISANLAQVPIYGSSDSVVLGNYASSVMTVIPPLPGITAFITVRHQPAAGGSLPQLYLYGDSWTVNSSISALYPPFEVFRSTATSMTNLHNIQVPMIPDGCYIPDGTYNGAGILSVTTSTGLKLRYAFQNLPNEGVVQARVTSTLLQFTVTGFRYAR